MKLWRRVATRYEKRVAHYLAMRALAALRRWFAYSRSARIRRGPARGRPAHADAQNFATAGPLHADRHRTQRRPDQVRVTVGGLQMRRRHGQRTYARGVGSGQRGRRILNDEAVRRRDPELGSGDEIALRVWLAAGDPVDAP